MFESEHQYFCIGKYSGGGGGGGAMVGNGAIVPRATHCKQSKLQVGLGTRLQE